MQDSTHDSPRLFDSESLRSRLMGDDELVAQVLEACVPDINANFKDFAEALESGEMKDATLRIHAMKGASQNADLTAVSLLALEIEQSLRAGQSRFARENVERLEEMVGETIGEVRRYLNN
ncbi:Hpt domain-containing protein [Pelagicoccus mobilis]|uniref:Hpt domain-containing protein n=1 Tax=Pelagicoccus mobilis TaxID=415221 RepID=A0A934S194_9BACT|nr:Hpt domain-containing protein [Pelagicoccus mobilis]MBK1878022.1 Hpt domain-containing protein [Pelagicoccus mobilis]